MTLTYLVISKYLDDKRIKKYFEEKKWKKLASRKTNPTIFYLDSMKIYDRNFWKYNSEIKNLLGEQKNHLTNKANLNLVLGGNYMMLNYNCQLGEDLNRYKFIFLKEKKWILKPIKGRQGIGIKIVSQFKELKNYFEEEIKEVDFKKIKETDKWVIQEYIDDPLLFNNKKFHLRVYFLIVGENIYYFNRYIIASAAKKYEKNNYQDKDIHDSHYNEKSIRNKIFPEDFTIDKSPLEEEKIIENINKQVYDIFKILKSNINLPIKTYPGDKNCYEIFAADIMVTKDFNLKVLEFNHHIGEPETMDKRYPLFENQMDIVLHNFGLLEKKDFRAQNYFIEIK